MLFILSKNDPLQLNCREHRVKRIVFDQTKCVGCRVCEAVCSLSNDNEFNPEKSRIRVIRTFSDGILFKSPVSCMHCEEPCCQSVCPASAISRDHRGAVLVDGKRCLGCRMCEIACPVGAVIVRSDLRSAVKCDLCVNYDEPQCARFCFGGALSFIEEERIGITRAREKAHTFIEFQKARQV
jgi:Fe-S-cluster-containing hydrogenase component 2